MSPPAPAAPHTSTFFQELAQQIESYLAEQMPLERPYPVVEGSRSRSGCIVNGPGESKHADIASPPRHRRKPRGPRLHRRPKSLTLRGDSIAEEFQGRSSATSWILREEEDVGEMISPTSPS
jgi:(E)-4-hydroxy-3-methylbut-2-enyl-diphosphate synthase